MAVTSTFKYTKTDLVREGFDPAVTADAIYFNHPEREAFVPVDQALFARIQDGWLAQLRPRLHKNESQPAFEAEHV
jgi:hypothetical protein